MVIKRKSKCHQTPANISMNVKIAKRSLNQYKEIVVPIVAMAQLSVHLCRKIRAVVNNNQLSFYYQEILSNFPIKIIST